jgi:hypothetical protein
VECRITLRRIGGGGLKPAEDLGRSSRPAARCDGHAGCFGRCGVGTAVVRWQTEAPLGALYGRDWLPNRLDGAPLGINAVHQRQRHAQALFGGGTGVPSHRQRGRGRTLRLRACTEFRIDAATRACRRWLSVRRTSHGCATCSGARQRSRRPRTRIGKNVHSRSAGGYAARRTCLWALSTMPEPMGSERIHHERESFGRPKPLQPARSVLMLRATRPIGPGFQDGLTRHVS